MPRGGGPRNHREQKSQARRARHIRAVDAEEALASGRWVTAAEWAETFNITRQAVQSRGARGSIPVRKVGTRRQYWTGENPPPPPSDNPLDEEDSPGRQVNRLLFSGQEDPDATPERIGKLVRQFGPKDVRELLGGVAAALVSGRIDTAVAGAITKAIPAIQRSVEKDRHKTALPQILAVPHRPAEVEPGVDVGSDDISLGEST